MTKAFKREEIRYTESLYKGKKKHSASFIQRINYWLQLKN